MLPHLGARTVSANVVNHRWGSRETLLPARFSEQLARVPGARSSIESKSDCGNRQPVAAIAVHSPTNERVHGLRSQRATRTSSRCRRPWLRIARGERCFLPPSPSRLVLLISVVNKSRGAQISLPSVRHARPTCLNCLLAKEEAPLLDFCRSPRVSPFRR